MCKKNLRMSKKSSTFVPEMTKEERANTLTHVIPLAASIAFAGPLIARACTSWSAHNGGFQILGTVLFLIGMVMMFGASTAYHAVSEPACKARLRVWDHIAIYVMIAGSYSPICLTAVGGWIGWSVFIFLWTCVIAGIVGKVIALGKHPNLSLALYLMMGWTALVIIVPMWRSMTHEAFWWIVAEGVFYTIGAYFFKHDEEHAYFHAIWHVFITLGALSHSIATWIILA